MWGLGRSPSGKGQDSVSSQNELGGLLWSHPLGLPPAFVPWAQPPSLLHPLVSRALESGLPASPHPSLHSLGSEQSFWIHFSRQEEARKTLR